MSWWSCRASRPPRSTAHRAQTDANIPARVRTVTPRSRASTSSMLRSGIAVDAVTASTEWTSRRSWPMCTSTCAARTRSRTGCSRRSEPDTMCPISANAIAIALMPGPPTPTTCSRCWWERSSGGTGAAAAGIGRAASDATAAATAADGAAANGVGGDTVECTGECTGDETEDVTMTQMLRRHVRSTGPGRRNDGRRPAAARRTPTRSEPRGRRGTAR